MASHRPNDTGPTFTFDIPHDPYFSAPALTSEHLNTEWLLTNGLGGYAMGAVVGCNTRRYHSLLIASPNPPLQRCNTVAAMHESLILGDDICDLDNHEFWSDRGTVFNPKGWHCLRRVDKSTLIRWTYRIRQYNVIKELRLVWKKQQALLTYRIEPATGAIRSYDGDDAPPRLLLRPLLAMRDFHHHRRADGDGSFSVEPTGDRSVVVSAPGVPSVHLACDLAPFTLAREWWYGFRHRVESERGQDDREDLFSPGFFEHTLTEVGKAVSEVRILISLDGANDFAAARADDGRAAHLAKMFEHVKKQVGDGIERRTLEGLVVAADDFVVDRTVDGKPMKTILAGYPWFADWGRDTMIALPGLLLTTGRFDEARQTLHAFARHIKRGLIPNVFDDYGGDPHYNTVDASLWFVHAALEYLRLTGDQAFWNDVLIPACREILASYAEGTDWNIRADSDGLITAGDEQTQLTWMDAKRDSTVFTPRHGKAVEINALWYRGLVGCSEFMAAADKKSAAQFKKLAGLVKKNFATVFWNEHLGWCNDVVNDRGPDGALRPNQVFAVSLPVSPLSLAQQKKVMSAVREHLLTPVGLRTLSRDHFLYKGRLVGSMYQRDEAYHQGTVWAWLIGGYVEGCLRASKFSAAAKQHCRDALQGMIGELNRNMGQVHEIFEGEPPHRPDGAQAQAWSIAELLRAIVLVES